MNRFPKTQLYQIRLGLKNVLLVLHIKLINGHLNLRMGFGVMVLTAQWMNQGFWHYIARQMLFYYV